MLEVNGDKVKLNEDLSLLLTTLELSASALSYDGQQLLGQVYGRLLPLFKNESLEISSSWANKCSFMKSLFDQCKTPQIPSFMPISSSLVHGPSDTDESSAHKLSFSELGNGDVYFDEITRLKSGNQFAVSLSTTTEELVVWNVYEEKPVRTLRGVFNPVNMKIIDDTRIVILCGRGM